MEKIACFLAIARGQILCAIPLRANADVSRDSADPTVIRNALRAHLAPTAY